MLSDCIQYENMFSMAVDTLLDATSYCFSWVHPI